MEEPVLVDIPFGTQKLQKWRPLRGLIEGMKDGATVRIRLPESGKIVENARVIINAMEGNGPNAWRYKLRTHIDKHDNRTLCVTKTYRD